MVSAGALIGPSVAGQCDGCKRQESVTILRAGDFEAKICSACAEYEGSLGLRLAANAAGPRTVWAGSPGSHYAPNANKYRGPWPLPWMHSQRGSAGSAALGAAAALLAKMRKGKMKNEKINVITFCRNRREADMSLASISAALTYPYDLLTLFNESYIDIEVFSPWKDNFLGILVVGHPSVRYLATASPFHPTDFMEKVKRALSTTGPTFIHSFEPRPAHKPSDLKSSEELAGEALQSGVWPLFEVHDGKFRLNYKPEPRKPVRDYLTKQGRYGAPKEEKITYVQKMIDDMWESWLVPGLIPIKPERA